MSKNTYEIAVVPRTEKGSSAVRRARKKGLVPAVIYSKGAPGLTVYVESSAWQAATRHDANLLQLKGEGIDKLAAVKEVQFNTLKNAFIHIDFNEVIRGEKMVGTILVYPKPGQTHAGAAEDGILQQELHELDVRCLPKDFPEHIEVSIAALEIGDRITVAELELPEGVKALIDGETTVFSVQPPRLEEVDEEETDDDVEVEVISAATEKEEEEDK